MLLPLFYHLNYQHISGKTYSCSAPKLLACSCYSCIKTCYSCINFTRFEFYSTHLFVTVISQRKDKSIVVYVLSVAAGPLFKG